MDKEMRNLEMEILKKLEGAFVNIFDENEKRDIILKSARSINPKLSDSILDTIVEEINDLGPIKDFLGKDKIEDIMVNNTSNIFVYDSEKGEEKLDFNIGSIEDLEFFTAKLKLYSTNEVVKGNVMDVHMPNGSRANIVSSPLGYNITIRNFKNQALSILDLINYNEMNYQIAARLWVYVDGFRVRPANLILAGMPASGKTTLLNAMFSFLRPDTRVITIEETYELDTKTQENCVRLETSEQMPMDELVKNSLRMRPDLIVIGEVRGKEANDMITAMNIGKIVMSTMHAYSSRDVINRLVHSQMGVPKDMIPAIDAIVILSQVNEKNLKTRKIVQISEISGIETQVLLSDLYKYDYKLHKGAPILPSITYRDIISNLLGIPPSDVLAEEEVRANILYKMNQMQMRDIVSINNMVKEYYDNPENVLKKLDLQNMKPVITV